MIKHPDGRLEGTPEELASYQQLMDGTQANRVPVQPVPTFPHPPQYPGTGTPWMPYPLTVTSGGTSPISGFDAVRCWNHSRTN